MVKTEFNKFAEILCAEDESKYSYLDSNGVMWKHSPDWIGKESVQMQDLSIKWVDEADENQVKKYL